MSKIKNICLIDSNNRYIGVGVAQESPIRAGDWLMPDGSIDIAPPTAINNEYEIFLVDGKWEQRKIKTQIDRYKCGIDKIPDGMIIDGDILRNMNTLELVEAGKLSKEQAIVLDLLDEENKLLTYLSDTAWYVERDCDYKSSGGVYGKQITMDMLKQRQDARDRISYIRNIINKK